MFMTPERWQQIKDVFNLALEYEPGQRSTFLSKACDNDAALQKEVESLLEAHCKDGSFIDSPAYKDAFDLFYTVNTNNVSNIWSQPIDGGSPKKITDFKEMLITGFAWSRDGKQLACTRGNLLRDAILITDLK